MNRYCIEYSAKNGLGKPALSLYLAGCDNPIKCDGCHNKEFWEPVNSDISLIIPSVMVDMAYFKNFHPPRLAILGGEPMAPWNRDITFEVAKKVRKAYTEAEIILYSWRSVSQVEEVIDTSYFDYGVFGPYVQKLHQNNMLPASSNQVIWDFKNKKELEHIIL